MPQKKIGINRTTLMFWLLKKIQEGKEIDDQHSTKYAHLKKKFEH